MVEEKRTLCCTISDTSGKCWKFTDYFRIGRSKDVELRVSETSVSRIHAEILRSHGQWFIRDCGSSNGTTVNQMILGSERFPLSSGDILSLGDISFRIEIGDETRDADINDPVETDSTKLVETDAHSSIEKVIDGIRKEEAVQLTYRDPMSALLRANLNLGNYRDEKQLSNSILDDAISVLNAQRAAIVLLNDKQELEVRNVKSSNQAVGRFDYSRNLALRCLAEGKSVLCPSSMLDPKLEKAPSVRAGQMNSILCVLLRTPRKRLGILHLDRNPSQKPFSFEDLQLADALAASVSAGLESAQLFQQQQELFLSTLTTLAQAVELRDPYTAGHAQRVTEYSLLLGKALCLSDDELHWLAVGTPLHDIGKIGIDDSILKKPDLLTPEEFKIMQTHPEKGEEMLSSLHSLIPIRPIVRSHHERWDGRGYPDGLAAHEIPLLARVVAVADTFDAMTTDRPYRRGKTFEQAIGEIKKGRNTQFDARCADSFVAIQHQIKVEMDSPGETVSDFAIDEAGAAVTGQDDRESVQKKTTRRSRRPGKFRRRKTG